MALEEDDVFYLPSDFYLFYIDFILREKEIMMLIPYISNCIYLNLDKEIKYFRTYCKKLEKKEEIKKIVDEMNNYDIIHYFYLDLFDFNFYPKNYFLEKIPIFKTDDQ